jgi:hypothetical protein
LITAAGGIAAPTNQRQLYFIAGNGGPIVVTANPQIGAGTTVGQEILIRVPVGSNTVELNDGNGLSLNGSMIIGGPGQSAFYGVWDGSVWFGVPPA